MRFWVRLGAGVSSAALTIACHSDPADADPTADTDAAADSTDASGASDGVDDGAESGATSGGQPDPDTGSGTDTGEPMPDPGDPFEPPPPLPTLPDDVVTQLAADIDGALTGAGVSGTTQTVLILDAETGQELYAKNPDTVLKPASNTKLFTTALAMETLGEDHRMETQVRAAAAPDGDGTIAGDLHVVLHHDFTWSALFGTPADLVLDRIALDLYALGVRSVGGALIVHGEAVYDGQSLGTYNAASHRSVVASTFATSLSQAGITVSGGSTTAADFEQPGQLLYTWRSPPLAVGAQPTNTVSHNEFADVLARHVGFELDGDSSYPAGEAALLEWLASIPVATAGLAFNDGSGLSHDNRVSARAIVTLLDFMLGQPEGLAWVRGLSIAGIRGTLQNRMLGADTAGRVWGKTGTLTGVIATSGVVYNRHDGRRYLVGMLMNDVGDNAAARAAQDAVFAIVARDHFGTPRPSTPVLAHVRAAESDVVEIAWSPVDSATGYLVWLSPDGKVWRRSDARWVQGAVHRAGELPFGPDVYVRVTAVGDGGDSDPSDVYGSRSESGTGRVLVVDGLDRWQAQPVADNPLGAGHDFVVAYGTALADAMVWDTTDNDAVIAGEVDPSDYDAVFWLLGEESTDHETFDATEQQIVADYLDAGGNLFVSGAELGWDLAANGDPADAAFLTDILHVDYIGDASQAWYVDGESGPFAGQHAIGFYTPTVFVAGYTDQLAPAPGAQAVATYYGGFGGTAAVAFTGDHRVVTLGFPFETIGDAQVRATTLAGALEAFGM